MPQPLRKVRQRVPRTEGRSPRVILHLPFPGVAALLVVFAVAVGWAFFMGVMVGKGQNPAERVSAMLHEAPRPETPPAAEAPETVENLLDQPLPLRAAQQDAPDAAEKRPATPEAQAAAVPPAAAGTSPQAAGQGEGQGAEQARPAAEAAAPTESAYPFARPQGESLAAWGIAPDGKTTTPRQEGKAAQAAPAPQAPAAKERPAAQAREPKFDYVYQTAAFRGKEEGDALRARLEEKGLRTRLQKSGKVYLVLVLLRGSEREAENVRETLRRMGLGKPIRLSKKAAR